MKGDAKAFSTLLAFAQQSGEFEKEPPRIDYIRRIFVKPGNLRLGTPPEVWDPDAENPARLESHGKRLDR
jgi:hypothetical protein